MSAFDAAAWLETARTLLPPRRPGQRFVERLVEVCDEHGRLEGLRHVEWAARSARCTYAGGVLGRLSASGLFRGDPAWLLRNSPVTKRTLGESVLYSPVTPPPDPPPSSPSTSPTEMYRRDAHACNASTTARQVGQTGIMIEIDERLCPVCSQLRCLDECPTWKTRRHWSRLPAVPAPRPPELDAALDEVRRKCAEASARLTAGRVA